MKLKIWIISVLFCLWLSLTICFAQDQNYCHDKESWKEWDKLVEKYPHDMDVQMLHAVRIGFCQKIKDGTITFQMAKDAFNHLHKTVYKKSKKEQEQWIRSKQL